MPPREPETPGTRAERLLRARLVSMASGDQLPAVRVLAAELSVSHATVAKVLKRLESEGLVNVVRSWGTFKA
jgi:DNA-binding transcriptional regulator YhcF (GntR family)